MQEPAPADLSLPLFKRPTVGGFVTGGIREKPVAIVAKWQDGQSPSLAMVAEVRPLVGDRSPGEESAFSIAPPLGLLLRLSGHAPSRGGAVGGKFQGAAVRYLVVGLISASLHLLARASGHPLPAAPPAPVLASEPSASVAGDV
jgi:hypothetical protein